MRAVQRVQEGPRLPASCGRRPPDPPHPTAPHCTALHCTWCVRAGPVPLVRWDAWSLVSQVGEGGEVSRWDSSGSSPLAMLGHGYGGSQPSLQYEGGVPHVRFERYARQRYAWLTSEGALTLPAEPLCEGCSPGLTMVLAVRIPSSAYQQGQGGTFERVFECAAAPDSSDVSLTFCRNSDQANPLFGYANAGMGWKLAATSAQLFDGGFQIYVGRVTLAPGFTLFARGAYQPLSMPGGAAMTLPRTATTCYLGRSMHPADPYLAGDIREVSIHAGAFTDDMMHAEYERQAAKWAARS